MIKLTNWTARRAGGFITLTAIRKSDTQPVKLTGIDNIAMDGATIIATHHSGTRYELEARK